ncbi:MAG: Na-translocating system protein MpsC family protein [Vicinamibacteria bacterium]
MADPGNGRAVGEPTLTKSQQADVSTALVQLYRRFYGRGPTRAKTIFDADVLTTVLAEIFTTVEETLVDRGRHELVTGVRAAFQEAMRHEFIATVEARTGREVEAFTSGVDIAHGIATETFILVPLPEDPAEPVTAWQPGRSSGRLAPR